MFIKRANKNNLVNNVGNFLLDMCKSCNLFILIGHCGQDKGIGSFTFRDISTIDYALSSFESLTCIQDFSIHLMDSLYTDGHSLIKSSFNFKAKTLPDKSSGPQNHQNQSCK